MSSSESPLLPISLEITPRGSKGFKSIRNVVWQEIPEFAILTGRNGSGKSQLLLYLAHALNQATNPQYPDLNELQIRIDGVKFEPGDLSSGEKVILQLALWLYNSRHHNRFPRLFLLSELDVGSKRSRSVDDFSSRVRWTEGNFSSAIAPKFSAYSAHSQRSRTAFCSTAGWLGFTCL